MHASSIFSFMLTQLTREYVADDEPGRLATVRQVSELHWEGDKQVNPNLRCMGTILMMDNRLHPMTNHSQRKDVPYYQKSFALNYLYAMRHNMQFLIAHPTPDEWLTDGPNQLCPAWCRVKILTARVKALLGRGGCHWLLYIDSDAYLREQHVNFLSRLNMQSNSNVHIAIAREEPPAGALRAKPRAHGVQVASLNAGVLFIKASSWSAAFLSAWMQVLKSRIQAECVRTPVPRTHVGFEQFF